MKMLIFLIMIPVLVRALGKHQACNLSSPLMCFKERNPCPVGIITLNSGAPVCEDEATNSMDDDLLNNKFAIETMTQFVRERIPERAVHAKGGGAFGYFEVTKDLTHICKSDFLSEIGKITPLAVRFSTTAGERGTSDANFGPRGCACKLYTKEGNLDIVGFNIPMFLYKDPITFTGFARSSRRHAATHQFDRTSAWDTFTLNKDMLHGVMKLYSGFGMPASYATMPCFGMHTFQVENINGDLYFIRIHILPKLGIKNVSRAEARNRSSSNADYMIKDMYDKIDKGENPSWNVYFQIMNETDVKKHGSKLFDVTRTVSEKDFPLHEVGEMVLNKNPVNYHAQVEQMAFCPGNKVRGFKGAPDRVYQARNFLYTDAALYRLGKNFNKIDVNCPFQVKTMTYNRDGVAPVKSNEFDYPNYPLNSYNGPVPCQEKEKPLIRIQEYRESNFDQARELYEELSKKEKDDLIYNLCYDFKVIDKRVRDRAVKLFTEIHPNLGNRLEESC